MTRAPTLLAVSDIEQMLVGRVEQLCMDLFPNGKREGRGEYRVGNIRGDAPRNGGSLAIRLIDGAKPAGTWKDFHGDYTVGGRDGGDLLWLIACAKFGGDLGKAVAWAKSWLRLDGEDPRRIEQYTLEARQRATEREQAAADRLRRTQASARKRWHIGVPIADTPADRYLFGRGIDIHALGRQPGALRFNPRVQHGYGEEARILPAMLAAINNLAGEHVATHRTWLVEEAGGHVRKAGPSDGVPKPKKVLGPFEGAHIALWKGACGTMPLRDVPAGTDIFVSEGIEDGLTAACARPELRIIAGISVCNIGALELPARVGWLVILAQNDPPGSDAEGALKRAIAQQRGRGTRVKIVRPPAGCKDLNELAMRSMTEEVA